MLADHGLIALVLGMHGHGRVAEHGLGADRGHGQGAGTVLQGIGQMIQGGFGRGVLNLVIGQGRVAARAPVDDILPTVDQPLLVQGDENFAHRPGQAFVHGETFAGPVHAGPQTADLVQDASAVVFLPFPDLFDEFFPTQVLALDASGHQFALNHVLSGDARMIRARHPEHGLAVLAHVAAHDVLQGDVQGMAHMQGAGDVGRRDDNGVIAVRVRGRLGRVRGERLMGGPVVQPAFFNVCGLVALGKGFSGHM